MMEFCVCCEVGMYRGGKKLGGFLVKGKIKNLIFLAET